MFFRAGVDEDGNIHFDEGAVSVDESWAPSRKAALSTLHTTLTHEFLELFDDVSAIRDVLTEIEDRLADESE